MRHSPFVLLPALRTALRRRGLQYAAHVVREHAAPRLAYRLLRGGGAPVALPVAHRVWGVADAAARRWQARPERDGGALTEALPAASDAPGLRHVKTLSAEQARDLERLLNSVHRTGITGLRRSLDELVVTRSGSFAFRQLRGVRSGQPRGVRFQVERDLDREAVNRRFGLSLMTESSVRRELKALRSSLPRGWFRDYAPIDFGGGISVGLFPSTDSGTGRWDFLNGAVVGPLVEGKRVLDLGSNNGSLPLMMLRAGAREVLAVEQSPVLASAMRLYHRVLEWRDMREYRLTVRVADMREYVAEDWGSFDVVTAFCSIYYLPAEDMAAIVKKAAASRATIVLQANEGATANPLAQPEALRALIRANGFGDPAVHNRDGFARPLLVGVPAGGYTHSAA
jgi:SAM-dependent methyltransferase